MHSLLYLFPLVLPYLVGGTTTTVDPSTPCLSGSCAYHILNTTNPHSVSSGTILINGSTSAISDLTPAAGWTILECDENATAQGIRAICTGDDNSCSHLYQNGAVGTIVRLPDNIETNMLSYRSAAPMPFARISSEWTHDNQTIPDSVAQKLRRRQSTSATVRGINLDIDFSKIDPNHHGHVSLTFQGATGNNATAHAPLARREAVTLLPTKRSILSKLKGAFESAGKAIKNTAETVGNDIKNTAETVGNDVKNAAETAGSEVASAAQAIAQGVEQALQAIEQSFDLSNSGSAPFSLDKTFTILQDGAQCQDAANHATFQANFDVSVEAKVSGNIQYGIVVEGTLVPPKISDFGLVATLDADLDGILNIQAQGVASLTSGVIQLFQVGLPGLDFPGVLTIGPSFEIKAEAIAGFEANANLAMDLAFSANGAKLYFPPSKGSSSGSFVPKDTNLKLTGDPSVTADGNIAAHLIPAIVFGVNALNGLAEADITLSLDASAQVDLSFFASRTTAFEGCTRIYTNLAVTADASASFFDLFSPSTSVGLWSHTYTLWDKCFSARRNHARNLGQSPSKRTAGSYSCKNLKEPGSMQTAISQTVPSSQIH